VAKVPIDREKVNRMVTQVLKMFHDSGAHPGEVAIALGEAAGRVIAATADMGVSEIAQRELLDLVVKQMAQTILANKSRIERIQ